MDQPELVEGLVEGAAGGVFVAQQLEEGVCLSVAAEGLRKQAGVLVVLPIGVGFVCAGCGRVDFEVLAKGVEAVREEAGLDANDAAEAPVGGGQVKDEGLLEDSGGPEFGAEAGEQLQEVGAVLPGQDDQAGSEPVLLSVAADGGLD
ncbi:MAG: hypothetical protein NTX87_15555 [Planctomycetota bacterium]|nr:hypothetical protein [Planctomycetota bacterium]